MRSDTKLTATDATDAKTLANSTSRRPESNGRRPGSRFGQNPGNKKMKLDFAPPSNAGDFAQLKQPLLRNHCWTNLSISVTFRLAQDLAEVLELGGPKLMPLGSPPLLEHTSNPEP